MKQDRKTAFRTIVTIASVVLCLVAFALFVVAIFADSSNSIPHQDDVKVHIYYLNDNDSIINRLQQDVSRLTRIVEDFQEDTLVISRSHPNNHFQQEQ